MSFPTPSCTTRLDFSIYGRLAQSGCIKIGGSISRLFFIAAFLPYIHRDCTSLGLALDKGKKSSLAKLLLLFAFLLVIVELCNFAAFCGNDLRLDGGVFWEFFTSASFSAFACTS